MKAAIYLAIVATMTLAQTGPLPSSPVPVPTDPTISALVTLVTNLGVLGVLVWHLWYHTTRAAPKQAETHTAQLAALQATFVTEQSATRAWAVEENTELRNMLIKTLNGMRDAVHDVRDTANVAVIKATVARKAAEQQTGPTSP